MRGREAGAPAGLGRCRAGADVCGRWARTQGALRRGAAARGRFPYPPLPETRLRPDPFRGLRPRTPAPQSPLFALAAVRGAPSGAGSRPALSGRCLEPGASPARLELDRLVGAPPLNPAPQNAGGAEPGPPRTRASRPPTPWRAWEDPRRGWSYPRPGLTSRSEIHPSGGHRQTEPGFGVSHGRQAIGEFEATARSAKRGPGWAKPGTPTQRAPCPGTEPQPTPEATGPDGARNVPRSAVPGSDGARHAREAGHGSPRRRLSTSTQRDGTPGRNPEHPPGGRTGRGAELSATAQRARGPGAEPRGPPGGRTGSGACPGPRRGRAGAEDMPAAGTAPRRGQAP